MSGSVTAARAQNDAGIGPNRQPASATYSAIPVASNMSGERWATRATPSIWYTAVEITTSTDGSLLSAATAENPCDVRGCGIQGVRPRDGVDVRCCVRRWRCRRRGKAANTGIVYAAQRRAALVPCRRHGNCAFLQIGWNIAVEFCYLSVYGERCCQTAPPTDPSMSTAPTAVSHVIRLNTAPIDP
jgi:hypothetical protein